MKKEKMIRKLNPGDVREQLHREFAVTHLIVLAYFFWWLVIGYGAPEPAEMKYVLGMPEWFFSGAIVGLAVFVVLAIAAIRTVFRETETEDEE